MGRIKRKLTAFIQYLSIINVKQYAWPLRILILTARSLLLAGQKFYRDLGFESATSLSFISILSMIPAGFLFFFFLKAFGLETFWNDIRSAVLENFVESSQTTLNKWFSVFEDNPISTLKNLPLYMLIIGSLIFSALWLLEASEKTLNRFWRATRKRSYIQRFTIFWVLVTASPFLLALSGFIKKQLESHSYFSTLIQSNVVLSGLYGIILPLFFATLAFFFLFLLLPATKVKIMPAMLGAIFAGIFWEIAKNWLIYFIPKAVTFNIYGSLGAVAACFLWVYMTWGVLLFGAQLSFVIQYPDHTIHLLSPIQSHYRLPAGFLALSVAVESAKAAADGKPPPTLSTLSRQWYCSKDALIEEITPLSPEYFHFDAQSDETCYLSKDSDQIYVKELLPTLKMEQSSKHKQLNIPHDIKTLLGKLEGIRKKALNDLTIRDIAKSKISLHLPDNA